VFNISTQTKFIDVLRQACEYWSMSCTGVLLVDRNQNAYPLNDTIVSCPGGVPSEVTLKKGTLRDLNTSIYNSNIEESDMSESKQDGEDENTARDHRMYATDKRPPKRNRVDCFKYAEMILYILSWSLLTVVVLVSLDSVEISSLHRSSTSALFETSFSSSITGDDVIFSEITSETEFWTWINGPLRSAISTDGTTSSTLSCPSGYTKIDTSTTETIDLGLLCTSSETYNSSETGSLCNRTFVLLLFVRSLYSLFLSFFVSHIEVQRTYIHTHTHRNECVSSQQLMYFRTFKVLQFLSHSLRRFKL